MSAGSNTPIIIKRKKVIAGGGHHGGAWKVAYADFVTAMMAFFMLLWLLGNTTEEQKQGIADYFSPVSVSASNSGSGQILGGQSIEDGGAMSTSASIMVPIEDTTVQPPNDGEDAEKEKEDAAAEEETDPAQMEIATKEEESFQAAEQELEETLSDLPSLAGISEHIVVDHTPEGMRIQIIDRDDRSMFQVGGKEPLAHTKEVLRVIAGVIAKMPNRIKVSGHTDSSGQLAPKSGYGNWELSSDRAQASRRVLNQAGLPANRIFEVTGKADTEPFDPFDPRAAANRRISIVLVREAPVLPPNYRN